MSNITRVTADTMMMLSKIYEFYKQDLRQPHFYQLLFVSNCLQNWGDKTFSGSYFGL